MTFDQFILCAAALYIAYCAVSVLNDYLNSEKEEEMDPLNDVAEDTLLEAKIKCLELAQAMWRHPDNSATADQIVKDAKAFWNFLTAVEDDEQEDIH